MTSRLESLTDYVQQNLLRDGKFICQSESRCLSSAQDRGAAFYEGQMSYVGKHYDDNGTSMRIMFVGQETGRTYTHFSLSDRYERVHDQLGVGTSFRARNPHMRGNTLALQVLFGASLASDELLVSASGERFHISDAFALANALLCSAVVPGTTKGRATPVMLANCRSHLKCTLESLSPNIIIAQGNKAVASLSKVITAVTEVGPHLSRCRLSQGEAFLCAFSHPSAWGSDRWASPYDPCFANVVRPTLLRARELVGS